ncbi:MAG: hypothetical protein ACMXYA_00840, partial [Candidatus Woesearchaeota archaeon]
EPTTKVVKIAKGAKTEDVKAALEKEGFTILKKGTARKTAARPKKEKIQHKKAEKTESAK